MGSSPEHLSLTDIESKEARRDIAEQAPKAVRDAESEVDRLIKALSRGEDPAIELGAVASDAEASEADERCSKRSDAIYLILSSKRALTKKYGKLGFEQLDSDLHDLRSAIEAESRRPGRVDLEAVMTYVDDEASLKRFGLQPVEPTNPWQVKKLVDSFDAQLAEEGREIQYLLIVGGDGIVPFHRLPNPVDDQDPDVPSDNPYASRDANYLIPERAIGRLPDGEHGGVGFLHSLIQTSVEAHRRKTVSKGLLGALGALFNGIMGPQENGQGLGYSASIWRKASRAVFHVIGEDGQLRTCPPLTHEGFHVPEPPRFSYFNLHGTEEGADWYGQRDALFPADYPLFPLALRPQDPSIQEHANAVVFTEACYGANILGKDEVDSIALRLMAVGALAVVGSTKTSYGSIAPPLLGADLMGKHFWEGIQARLTVGEALQHAKVTMTSKMQEQQGFLDDEDQKALISFVLYGDPSLQVVPTPRPAVTSSSADGFCPPLICSKRAQLQRGRAVRPASDELVATVKARIETSLPHMSHARVRVKPLAVCTAMCESDCEQLDDALRASVGSSLEQKGLKRDGWAVTLHKEIRIRGEGAHQQVVKVVVDDNGHILKMAVSK